MRWLVRWVLIGLHQLPARMRKSARRREQHEVFDSLLEFYNGRHPHSSLDGATPDQAYFTPLPIRTAA